MQGILKCFWEQSLSGLAFYGLKKIAYLSEQIFGEDIGNFLQRDFYLDDGLNFVCYYCKIPAADHGECSVFVLILCICVPEASHLFLNSCLFSK